MRKQEIIRRLEEVWGEIPGWMEAGSSASLEQYLERLGWEVGSKDLSVRVNPAKVVIIIWCFVTELIVFGGNELWLK